MYVSALKITNLRCFASADLDFIHPAQDTHEIANVTLLLGDNAAGKTTILRAIALAILGESLLYSGFVPDRLIRRTDHASPPRAVVQATCHLDSDESSDAAPKRFTTDLTRRGDFDAILGIERPDFEAALYDESSPHLFLVGYGATRRVETSDRVDLSAREKLRRNRYQRVATLFEEHVSLTPLSIWLPHLRETSRSRHAEVERLINAMLDGQARMTGAREGTDYLFEVNGVSAPFNALSDGYRAYIGWIGDLLYHMCQVCPTKTALHDLTGVVLVDEVDLHLHPDWQRTVVPRLSKALPRLQFVFTTHSPLVTGTLHTDNIRVVRVAPDGTSSIQRLRERAHGLGTDQLLLGGYFNLPSTRAPDVDDTLRDLSRRARAGDDDASVELLRTLVRGTDSIDESPIPAPEPRPRPAKPRKRPPKKTRRSSAG
mgnify:CR=1 FL=1